MTEKPFGLKISAGIYVLIGLLASFVGVSGYIGMTLTPDLLLAPAEEQSDIDVEEIRQMMQDEEMNDFFTNIFLVIALLGVIHLVVAYFLWKGNKNARYAALVISFFGLWSFPIGTALHAIVLYYLWFDDETKVVFS